MSTLLISPALGIFWLVFLFGACFLFVHTARLAKIGREYQKQTLKRSAKQEEEQKQEQAEKSENTEKQKPSPQAEREPIYYIVEKKRRAKTSFSEPKEIRFK